MEDFQLGHRTRKHRNRFKQNDAWLDAPERVAGVNLERDPILGNLEYFFKRGSRSESVAFTRLHAGGDVLETLRHEYELVAGEVGRCRYILVHEPFNVELAQHEELAHIVEAHIANVIMDFALEVGGLRCVGGRVAHFDEATAQHRRVDALYC